MKRSLVISGHATSISLEAEFWAALKDIAEQKNMSIAALIKEIDLVHTAEKSNEKTSNLSSRIRVYILQHYIT
ncbi:MAG: ribbon-helix-helix domain-containing protein [Alphaproteobacteria bacterium]|nr:ribbon-helix-helix domain-containing protein [Alphaproteobacteria bacterium]